MFSKEQKVKIVALNYMAAIKDLEQGYEAGFIPFVSYMMAVNRLIHNTVQTIISIGCDEGFKLFYTIIEHDPTTCTDNNRHNT